MRSNFHGALLKVTEVSVKQAIKVVAEINWSPDVYLAPQNVWSKD